MKKLESLRMTNVIAFPRRIEAKIKGHARTCQAQTLFLHVKRTTLIVHLSGASIQAAAGRATNR